MRVLTVIGVVLVLVLGPACPEHSIALIPALPPGASVLLLAQALQVPVPPGRASAPAGRARIGEQSVPSADLEQAVPVMRGFLEAWLVDGDKARTTAHFIVDDATVSVAPRVVWVLAQALVGGPSAVISEVFGPRRRVWIGTAEEARLRSEYWRSLERFRVDPAVSVGSGLEGVLDAVDPDLRRIIESELSVSVGDSGLFLAFVARDERVINSFDAGFGDVAEVLRPREQTVLVLIADFRGRAHLSYQGPFVAFWVRDPVDGAWRIAALGAVPEGMVFVDGFDSGLGRGGR